MNIVVTSKDEILKTNRELIQKQGWSAVSIPLCAAGAFPWATACQEWSAVPAA